MSQAVSSQQESTSSTSPKYRRLTTATLWTVQALLAFLFLFAGAVKLIVPVEVMMAQMPLKLSGLFVHFIGVCEVAGALGLVLPGLTRVRRELGCLGTGIGNGWCDGVYTAGWRWRWCVVPAGGRTALCGSRLWSPVLLCSSLTRMGLCGAREHLVVRRCIAPQRPLTTPQWREAIFWSSRAWACHAKRRLFFLRLVAKDNDS